MARARSAGKFGFACGRLTPSEVQLLQVVIETVDVGPALGVRTSQNVVLILGALRHADARMTSPLGVEHIRLLHVVAARCWSPCRSATFAGDQRALDVEPGPGTDAIPRIHARLLPRCC